MQFIAAAAHYLLGIPIFGWGDQVGFVYKGLLFLVALLIFTAYILLADRKIWAAVQVRRGPSVVAPLGSPNGELRSLDRLRHHHRAALRRLAEPFRHRHRAAPDGPRSRARRA